MTRIDTVLSAPEQLQAAAEDLSWRKGKIHALRPVFRELGLPAAFVCEALEHSPGLSTAEIVRMTGLSRTAASEALQVMAAWNMVARGAAGAWAVVASTSLNDLAEHFGVMESVAAQMQRYRNDRVIWREWLARNVSTVAELLAPEEDYPGMPSRALRMSGISLTWRSEASRWRCRSLRNGQSKSSHHFLTTFWSDLPPIYHLFTTCQRAYIPLFARIFYRFTTFTSFRTIETLVKKIQVAPPLFMSRQHAHMYRRGLYIWKSGETGKKPSKSAPVRGCRASGQVVNRW